MKPQDIFSLALRIIGLAFVYHAIMATPAIFYGAFMMIPQAGFFLIVGWWFLGGANLLQRRAYPQTESPPQGSTDTGGPGHPPAKAA